MLSAPTDKLYKFWAVLGLALIGAGVPISINAYDSGRKAELEFLSSFEPAQRAYSRFAGSLNDAKSEIRAYNRKPSAESWADLQTYLAEHQAELDDLERAAEEADEINRADLRSSEHARRVAWIWFGLGISMLSFGAISSFLGFRNWVRREA